jgi:hypothetical protein
MTNKIIEIATKIAAPQTQLILLHKNPSNQRQLVTSWQLDEQKKLYCQWIQDINQ